MSAAKDRPTVSAKVEAPEELAPEEQPATATATVLAPFQVYWNQVAYVGGETVTLPVDVVDRYVLAGWIERTK